jgi:hypothetical protein
MWARIPEMVSASAARRLPAVLRNGVVCLGCFDDSVERRDVPYAASLRSLWFAGDS